MSCYKLSMRREFSAGGVAIRRLRGEWVFAAIRPGGKKPGIWALPKGLIGEGEKPDEGEQCTLAHRRSLLWNGWIASAWAAGAVAR